MQLPGSSCRLVFSTIVSRLDIELVHASPGGFLLGIFPSTLFYLVAFSQLLLSVVCVPACLLAPLTGDWPCSYRRRKDGLPHGLSSWPFSVRKAREHTHAHVHAVAYTPYTTRCALKDRGGRNNWNNGFLLSKVITDAALYSDLCWL